MDFTLDQVNFKELPALVDQMRAEGMRFIFILVQTILNYWGKQSCFHEMLTVMRAERSMQSDISTILFWPEACREMQFVPELHALFVCVLQDPAIAGNETKGTYPAFDTGIEKDVFIKWPPELSNDIVWGKV